MAPPKSVRLIRSISQDKLRSYYRRERDPDRIRQILALYHMVSLQNCQKVADIILVTEECVRNWVHSFNREGVESFAPKKKTPGDHLS